jgi:hypothetical protein
MKQTNDYVINSVTVTPVGIAENSDPQIPKTLFLEVSKPNPFHSQTIIRYTLPKETAVSLQIYNVVGNLVRTLKDGLEKPGIYSVIWDGADDNGNKVTKGVYFYRLSAGKNRVIKKVIKLD